MLKQGKKTNATNTPDSNELPQKPSLLSVQELKQIEKKINLGIDVQRTIEMNHADDCKNEAPSQDPLARLITQVTEGKVTQ